MSAPRNQSATSSRPSDSGVGHLSSAAASRVHGALSLVFASLRQSHATQETELLALQERVQQVERATKHSPPAIDASQGHVAPQQQALPHPQLPSELLQTDLERLQEQSKTLERKLEQQEKKARSQANQFATLRDQFNESHENLANSNMAIEERMDQLEHLADNATPRVAHQEKVDWQIVHTPRRCS